MRNRDFVIQYLKQHVVGKDTELAKEIAYFLNHYEDNKMADFDLADAFNDALDLNGEKGSIWHEAKKIYVAIGYAEFLTAKKLEAMVVSSGKKWWFKYKGKSYGEVGGWEEWLEAERK